MPIGSVCETEMESFLCPNCGFDSSCHYEQYPTLQSLPAQTQAISILKSQWQTSHTAPSVEHAIATLRAQGWDAHVLSAVEKILNRAANDLFAAHQTDETCSGEAAPEKATVSVPLKSLPKLSQFCDKCGASNHLGSLYCLGCGAKLNASAATQKPDAPAQQPPTPVDLSKFCNRCGTAILSGTIYCPGCGAKTA